eukprot:CAMPEP_0198359842 /NCGR_PEP_ID=MMETSP1450-20131203/136040_1 /TAXON_ID=753684 ORGANISM="Madagascaria erythrocladiodes, Strain CCMP3234" /NCGR_SAMPLE_ID=MMETSP1450 /ASSEMBLY_ACC=CAM_ASM_001115 /LENGTH=115 /DNA_ID=CAMNT_0044066767 /DNA_START=31 /DNA_END=375 /DNA_ORIENTATION=+
MLTAEHRCQLVATAADQLASLLRETLSSSLPGTRTALLRLVAISAYRCSSAQEAVMGSKGGVGAVLASIGAIDTVDPTAREWGIMAIRNLAEGNLRVQAEIASLELREARESPEL